MVQQSPLEARATLPTSLDTTGPGRQCIPQTPGSQERPWGPLPQPCLPATPPGVRTEARVRDQECRLSDPESVLILSLPSPLTPQNTASRCP